MNTALFSRDDLSAFWALFADNLANMLIISGVCRFVFGMPDEIVFGRILPGLGIAIIIGSLVYVYMAQRLAEAENRTDVTALPYGISTPVMFIYLFGVIGPIFWATEDAVLAWQVGIAAGVIGGFIEIAGSVIGPWLKRVTPAAGMLGTLSGIAITFIASVALARIYESPLIGFISLAFVLWGLVGNFKLPLNLPPGLTALLAGTLVGLALGESTISFEGVGLYIPLPYFSDVFAGLNYLFSNPELLAVIIPVQIYNFIETMNNVESAESVGDKYPVHICQITDGIGTSIGGLFGSPFPTTVYIGHPAYKRMKARSGYVLGVGLVFFIGSIFGLVAFMGNLIPTAAVAPILMFVGISIVGFSFNACPRKHAVAVAVGVLPHISSLLVTKWNSQLSALSSMGIEGIPGLTDADFVAAMLQQGALTIGQSTLASGAIITGMLWGGFMAYLIDAKFNNAVYFTLAAAVLTAFGFIHSPTLTLQLDSPLVWGYLIIGAVVFIVARFLPEEELQKITSNQ